MKIKVAELTGTAEKPKPKPVKHEVWLSLYPDGSASIYRSKRLADECAGPDRIECRHIEWEAPA